MSTVIDPPPSSSYVYADRPDGPGLHGDLVQLLAEVLDPFTRRRLDTAGVSPGDRCLELGAGAGSIAALLLSWVGRDGEVVATDVDPSNILPMHGLTVMTHDVVTDPLPGRFDLIHARMLLGHLPQRDPLVAKLAAALNPGGALVVEQFDPDWDRCLLYAPDPQAPRLFTAYHHALMRVLSEAGTDPGWGRQVHQVMCQVGLQPVQAEFWSRTWHGGEAGCLLARASATQLRDRLVAAGMSPGDLGRFQDLLCDPRLVIRGATAVSTIGWAPRPDTPQTAATTPAAAAAAPTRTAARHPADDLARGR